MRSSRPQPAVTPSSSCKHQPFFDFPTLSLFHSCVNSRLTQPAFFLTLPAAEATRPPTSCRPSPTSRRRPVSSPSPSPRSWFSLRSRPPLSAGLSTRLTSRRSTWSSSSAGPGGVSTSCPNRRLGGSCSRGRATRSPPASRATMVPSRSASPKPALMCSLCSGFEGEEYNCEKMCWLVWAWLSETCKTHSSGWTTA